MLWVDAQALYLKMSMESVIWFLLRNLGLCNYQCFRRSFYQYQLLIIEFLKSSFLQDFKLN
ncbi:unnamed protein product [Paramecium octaurelia]|uniref:Uncharacterized protein n=1 Tax=Paramecium octaurelia TaxID=43137 RepID=A0A8S1VXW6_PAROT|nr:unnamed protein product [Paramecium octaurelia]